MRQITNRGRRSKCIKILRTRSTSARKKQIGSISWSFDPTLSGFEENKWLCKGERERICATINLRLWSTLHSHIIDIIIAINTTDQWSPHHHHQTRSLFRFIIIMVKILKLIRDISRSDQVESGITEQWAGCGPSKRASGNQIGSNWYKWGQIYLAKFTICLPANKWEGWI